MLITLKAAILMPHPGLTMEPQEIYRAIAETLPGEPPMLVRWVLNGNTYCWNIPVAVGETWLQLGQASAIEAHAVADAIKEYRQRVGKALRLPDDLLDAIFSTPDDRAFIFFSHSTGMLRVAIAAWGLRYKDGVNAIDGGVPVWLIDGNTRLRRTVKVGFTGGDAGVAMPGVRFLLELPSGLVKEFVTPQSGLYDLGEFIAGTHICISVPGSSRHFGFDVLLEQEDYLFALPSEQRKEETPPGNGGGNDKKDTPVGDSRPNPPVDGDRPEPPRRKRPGRPVKNAPTPFTPDPGKEIYDPGRRHYIYSNCIFAIIDPAASKSEAPLADFCRQFSKLYPGASITTRDEFCNMVTMEVDPVCREAILRELPGRITGVAFYADAVSVFCCGSHDGSGGAWHIDAVGARQAWRKTRGSKDVRVAVVDTYFDLSHPAFKGMRIESALSLEDGTDNVAPPSAEDDGAGNVASPSTYGEHGTHVLGLIGTQDGGECSGIAPGCTFIPVSLGKEMNTVSELQGVLYALHRGATVINLSIGLKFSPEEAAKLSVADQVKWWQNRAKEHEALWNYVYGMLDRGYCTIVWAAGNNNLFELIDSSKRHDGMIRVDAVDCDLGKADFSNFGNIDQMVDGRPLKLQKSVISAPGVSVLSTVPGGKWASWNGTSMAAPIVAGAVALIKSIDATLTNDEIVDVLRSTAQPLSDSSIGPLLRIDRAIERVASGLSPWDEFALNPTAGLGVWKKIDQTTYVDTDTQEFKFYGQNYLAFDSHDSGEIEVHIVGRDCVYNARFRARWKVDEALLDIVTPFKSVDGDDEIMTSQIRLYRDDVGNVAFEVLKPSRTSRSHLRRLGRDDRINKNKRKL